MLTELGVDVKTGLELHESRWCDAHWAQFLQHRRGNHRPIGSISSDLKYYYFYPGNELEADVEFICQSHKLWVCVSLGELFYSFGRKTSTCIYPVN